MNIEKTKEIVKTIDMSVFGLISQADIIVKIVIFILLISSIITWAIIIDKFIKIRSINKLSNQFEKSFWAHQSFNQLYEKIKGRINHPLANIFIGAMHEFNSRTKLITANQSSGIKDRINQTMRIIHGKEIDKIESGIYFLAIVASNSPFIGLFGTVWGIMHSFQSIAASKNTTLAVVAPGIAEALLATAIGLITAIPAAIFYNILIDKSNRFANKLDDFASEIGVVLSKDIDDR